MIEPPSLAGSDSNRALRQMVLELYATASTTGLTQALLYHQLAGFQPGTSYRQIAQLVSRLTHEGLLRQFGTADCHRITDAGALATITAAPSGNALWKSQPHPGAQAFDEFTGHLVVATTASDEDCRWRLWSAAGAHTALVAGSAGSGVTSVLRGALRALGPSQSTRLWVIDFSGELYADAVLHADRYADSFAQVEAMLHDVRRVIADRTSRLAARRFQWAGPTGAFRLGVLMLADLPTVLSGYRGELEAILRTARAAGVSVVAGGRNVVASGLPPLTRSAFAAGNVLALRGATHTPAATLLNPALIKAQSIPKTWPDGSNTAGLGYDGDTLVRTFEVSAP